MNAELPIGVSAAGVTVTGAQNYDIPTVLAMVKKAGAFEYCG